MRLGVLQAGHAPKNMISNLGDYDELIKNFLKGFGFQFNVYSVVDMDFPKDPSSADCWIISGSRHGVYDNLPFIEPLEKLITDIYTKNVPLIGICFGHQIIAKAFGGKVEKFKNGWCVGLTKYNLEGKSIYLNAWHQDQIVAPPENSKILGSNSFCKYAFLSYGSNIFSVQAHPEFNNEFIRGLIQHRGKGLVPQTLLDKASEKLQEKNSNHLIAEKIGEILLTSRIST